MYVCAAMFLRTPQTQVMARELPGCDISQCRALNVTFFFNKSCGSSCGGTEQVQSNISCSGLSYARVCRRLGIFSQTDRVLCFVNYLSTLKNLDCRYQLGVVWTIEGAAARTYQKRGYTPRPGLDRGRPHKAGRESKIRLNSYIKYIPRYLAGQNRHICRASICGSVHASSINFLVHTYDDDSSDIS